MSNGDAPYKHTRSFDLKRKPIPDMASRHLHMDNNSENDQSQNSSFDSSTKSPKTSATSPGARRRGIYPEFTPGKNKETMYPDLSPGEAIDEPDSSKLNDSHDTSYGTSHSDINQSAKKARSPPKSPRRARRNPRETEDRIRTNLYPSLEPSEPTEGGGVINIIIALGVIVLAVAAFALFYTPSPEKEPDKLTVTEIFLRDFKELKNSYPSQDARFWKIIGSQVKRVLSNDSAYPAVILLGTPEGYAALGTCLAKRVIGSINNAARMSGDVYIDTASLDQTSAAKSKFNLDQHLKTVFDESKGAIIDHVEKLPAKAALLLHGYCDGDNAPYKDVVLFLLLHTDVTRDSLSDKVVEKSLTDLWGNELGVDEMPALCSRIANNIVVLSPEEDETLATCT